jgi:hypothetical protein
MTECNEFYSPGAVPQSQPPGRDNPTPIPGLSEGAF